MSHTIGAALPSFAGNANLNQAGPEGASLKEILQAHDDRLVALASNATLSSATPAAIGANVAPTAGVSTSVSRADHVHAEYQAPQFIVAAGAFTPDQATELTAVDLATAANNVTATLADGTVAGQKKRFTNVSVSAGKTTQVTVTHCTNGTTHVVTMTAAGDGFEVVWSVALTKWIVSALFGGATIA